MITYYKISEYLETVSSLEARLTAVKAILDNMQTAMIAGALNSNKQEYRMDDGQTKIEVVYADFKALTAAYKDMLTVKDILLATLNINAQGRITRRIDSKNFPGNRYGNY